MKDRKKRGGVILFVHLHLSRSVLLGSEGGRGCISQYMFRPRTRSRVWSELVSCVRSSFLLRTCQRNLQFFSAAF